MVMIYGKSGGQNLAFKPWHQAYQSRAGCLPSQSRVREEGIWLLNIPSVIQNTALALLEDLDQSHRSLLIPQADGMCLTLKKAVREIYPKTDALCPDGGSASENSCG